MTYRYFYYLREIRRFCILIDRPSRSCPSLDPTTINQIGNPTCFDVLSENIKHTIGHRRPTNVGLGCDVMELIIRTVCAIIAKNNWRCWNYA